MFGNFDIGFQTSWSHDVASQCVTNQNLKHSVVPEGKTRGCLESVVKCAKVELIKKINESSKKTHGLCLGVTFRQSDDKEEEMTKKRKRRKLGVFYDSFVQHHEGKKKNPPAEPRHQQNRVAAISHNEKQGEIVVEDEGE